MMKIINERGHTWSTSAELQICRDIKEKYGYVAKKFDIEMKWAATSPDEVAQVYDLPDGNQIRLLNEHFRCPEALFQPAVIGNEGYGIHEITYNAIMKAPVDLRLSLYNNVVLCGGSTCFKGLPERMKVELIKAAPLAVGSNVTVIATDKRKHLAWIGTFRKIIGGNSV